MEDLKPGIFNPKGGANEKFVILLSVFVFVGVFGYGSGMAANPSKIKVGILLPLTDFFPKLKEL
ncbi:MAG: hypothetical protein KKG96_02765, partial [Proteobacteria bacterium]|nr:hypothetical protein [Pseudomonadota bacterium]